MGRRQDRGKLGSGKQQLSLLFARLYQSKNMNETDVAAGLLFFVCILILLAYFLNRPFLSGFSTDELNFGQHVPKRGSYQLD